MDLLPPRWLDIQDDVESRLSDISATMKKLDHLHAKHVLPGFDDESVKAGEEREISSLTTEITRGFTACQSSIKRVDKLVQEQARSRAGGLSKEDETMARNLKISLATRVGDVSTTFRKKQTAYLKKLRSLGGMPALDAGNSRTGTPLAAANPYTDPAMQDSEIDRSAAQSTLLQTAQVRRRTGMHDAAIEQREREIEKIAQGVIDLSNMFQDLNSMVIDQGSLLDRIDYNVERTSEHVQAAEKELTVATGYQKRSTKRKILLLLILLVVGMFILLLVKPKRRGEPAAAPAPIQPPKEGLPPRSLGDVGIARRRDEWKQRRRRFEPYGSSVMYS